MVHFSVPQGKGFFDFSVESGRVLFAGSRYGHIPRQVSSDLVSMFGRLGFAFLTGCANGVDESFRHALAESEYSDSSIVACAFKDRAETLQDLTGLFVVPDGLPPRVALAKRTWWMTSRCSLMILFPLVSTTLNGNS